MWRCGERGVKTCEAASEQVFRAKILAWSKIERPCEPLDTAHSITRCEKFYYLYYYYELALGGMAGEVSN